MAVFVSVMRATRGTFVRGSVAARLHAMIALLDSAKVIAAQQAIAMISRLVRTVAATAK